MAKPWPIKTSPDRGETICDCVCYEAGRDSGIDEMTEAIRENLQNAEDFVELIQDINFVSYGFSHEDVAHKTAKEVVALIERKMKNE